MNTWDDSNIQALLALENTYAHQGYNELARTIHELRVDKEAVGDAERLVNG